MTTMNTTGCDCGNGDCQECGRQPTQADEYTNEAAQAEAWDAYGSAYGTPMQDGVIAARGPDKFDDFQAQLMAQRSRAAIGLQSYTGIPWEVAPEEGDVAQPGPRWLTARELGLCEEDEEDAGEGEGEYEEEGVIEQESADAWMRLAPLLAAREEAGQEPEQRAEQPQQIQIDVTNLTRITAIARYLLQSLTEEREGAPRPFGYSEACQLVMLYHHRALRDMHRGMGDYYVQPPAGGKTR